MRCQRPGCPGFICDGYCDVCGLPAVATSSSPTPSIQKASQSGRGVPGMVPSLRPTGPCQMPGCGGRIVDGYCDTCGAPPQAAKPSAPEIGFTTARIGTVNLGSARVGKGKVRSPASDSETAGHLGSGYTTITPEPPVDPDSAILENPEVPEDRRFCPHCEAEVGRSTKTSPGRVEGYCPSCRKPYSFTPKLNPGDVVAGQYEVRGALAHGGMGWVYLAQDRNVSNRWVVLKGLLNPGDDASMKAALSEQHFLAQIQHPLIVEIYNFVNFEGGVYIVMEFVGGRSLKQILKDRMNAAGGRYDPLPVDQALAYVFEILPAFSYLHSRGLLYCDFKPDNLIHVEDSVKLIDMGGVRRLDDDDSIIFGTIGYQAPEISTQGCSVASDIFTIGRTLLILCCEVKQYQTTYATTIPPIDQVPTLTRYESVYRLIAKCCAPDPSDRFSSVAELRRQMVGVLREIAANTAAATASVPSEYFDPPTVVADAFTWKQLPRLKPNPRDPAMAMLASMDPAMTASQRFKTLMKVPTKTFEVQIALCMAAIETGDNQVLAKTVNEVLERDPWEWRAAWIEGLAALNAGEWVKAQSCFNAVYVQVPGELAPKFALAVACEMGSELDIAEHLYQICASTDGAYVPGAAFGMARVRGKKKGTSGQILDMDSVLAALDLVPATSGGWPQSRRLTASYLIYANRGIPDLAKAYEAVLAAGSATDDRLRFELEIFSRALPLAGYQSLKAARGRSVPSIGNVAVTKADIKAKIETILRHQASVEPNLVKRVALIDQANSLRKWTVV